MCSDVSLLLAGQFHEQRQRDRDKLRGAQQHDLTIRDKKAVKQARGAAQLTDARPTPHTSQNKLQISVPVP